MNKKGQNWSLDLMLGIIIFGVIGIILLAQYSLEEKGKVSDFQDKAKLATMKLSREDFIYAFIQKGEVDENILEKFIIDLKDPSKNAYNYARNSFGLREENFCIYFLNQDNNVVLINGSYVGIGNGNVTIDGIQCGNEI